MTSAGEELGWHIQRVQNPISVARKVMRQPHVLIRVKVPSSLPASMGFEYDPQRRWPGVYRGTGG